MSSFNNMFKKNKDKSKRNSINITDFSLNLNREKKEIKDTSSLSSGVEVYSDIIDQQYDVRTREVYSDLDPQYEIECEQKYEQRLPYEQKFEQNYETKDNFKKLKNKFDTPKPVAPKPNTFVCETCNMSSSNSQFIILNCNHIFHINCLAKLQLKNAINCQVIDNDSFFNKVKCSTCNDPLESSEIMMIHNKFYKGTSVFINDHNKTLNKLESQINVLKEEMKVCMEYKQKLEFEQQKSKQILTLLNTLPI
jgi:hypothetical protein